jgi:hypothetical protein
MKKICFEFFSPIDLKVLDDKSSLHEDMLQIKRLFQELALNVVRIGSAKSWFSSSSSMTISGLENRANFELRSFTGNIKTTGHRSQGVFSKELLNIFCDGKEYVLEPGDLFISDQTIETNGNGKLVTFD